MPFFVLLCPLTESQKKKKTLGMNAWSKRRTCSCYFDYQDLYLERNEEMAYILAKNMY
jgi:hypothetical protein